MRLREGNERTYENLNAYKVTTKTYTRHYTSNDKYIIAKDVTN
jgi:hypothetical protein